MVRSLLQFACIAGLSVFVLFLDLEKAYDKVVRETVFGIPHSCPTSLQTYLQSIGLLASLASSIADNIQRELCVFDEAGVDPSVTRAINVLHSGSWFHYGTRPSVITSKSGGRQGCKLGGIIFSVAYMRALRKLRQALRRERIPLKVKFDDSRPFWSEICGELLCDDSASFTASWSTNVT